MVRSCALKNCFNSTRSKYRFFVLPSMKNIGKRNRWIANCGDLLSLTPQNQTVYLCEGHFDDDQWKWNGEKECLKIDSAPTIFTTSPPRRRGRRNFQVISTTLSADHSVHKDACEKTVLSHESSNAHPQYPPTTDIPHDTDMPAQPINANNNLGDVNECLGEIKNLQRQLVNAKRQIRETDKKLDGFKVNSRKFLNDDQLRYLELVNPRNNTRRWTEETIRKGIRILCKVGAASYEYLRVDESFPLPSYSILFRRISHIKFAPGVVSEMIPLLGDKIKQDPTPNAHLCVLSFDEMSITPSVEYDCALKRYIGLITPELAADEAEAQQQATHALAVVARGATSHWKQPISYVLTGMSLNARKLWEYLLNLIKILHQHGIQVVCLSCDSGPGNQALMALLGIHSIRSQCQPSFPHPMLEGERMYVSPDREHLLKNMWCQLSRTEFHITEEIREANNLPGRVISMNHVKWLLVENNHGRGGITVAHKLKPAHVEPAQFKKMDVRLAREFFSNEVGISLILLARDESSAVPREAETTGWFICHVSRWYEIMSARNQNDSLGKNEDSADRIDYLEKFMSLMKSLSFSGGGSQWKPIQRGTVIATETTVQFHRDYVLSGRLDYFLPSRFGSSPCENLFSQARSSDMHPKPVRLRHKLRLISVAMFLRCSQHASYEDDEEAYYVDCLRGNNDLGRKMIETEILDLEIGDDDLNKAKQYGIYYIGGWVARKLGRSCEDCYRSLVSPEPDESLPCEWTNMIDQGGLLHPTGQLNEVVTIAERIVQSANKQILTFDDVIGTLAGTIIAKIPPELKTLFCSQHDTVMAVVRKFLSLRVHVLARDVTLPEVSVEYGSKSGFMRTSANLAGKGRS